MVVVGGGDETMKGEMMEVMRTESKVSRGKKEKRRSRWRERDGGAERNKVNKLLIAGERLQKQNKNKRQHKSQSSTYEAEEHMPVGASAEGA